jgi:hypothetical protein
MTADKSRAFLERHGVNTHGLTDAGADSHAIARAIAIIRARWDAVSRDPAGMESLAWALIDVAEGITE